MIESYSRRMWCSLPGIIESVDFQKMTCVIQPSIRMPQIKESGERISIDLPLLKDVPVYYPQGGFGVLTFPVKKGDECLVVFADRCIDAWWQNGGIQEQMDYRCHDLSDGFAFVGFRSQPRVLKPPPDPEATQLRSEDGKTMISMTKSGSITAVAPERLRLCSPNIEMTGIDGACTNVTVNGSADVSKTVTAGDDVVADGVSLVNHLHGCSMCGTTKEPV